LRTPPFAQINPLSYTGKIPVHTHAFCCVRTTYGDRVLCCGIRYNHLISAASLWPHFGLPALCETNVCHAAELPIVFDVHEIRDPLLNITLTPEEAQLSDDMDTCVPHTTSCLRSNRFRMFSLCTFTGLVLDSYLLAIFVQVLDGIY